MDTPLRTSRRTKHLVCADAREESRVALRLACMKAQARGSAVDILHVISPADFQTLGGVAERMREERIAEGEQLLKKLSEEAKANHGITPGMILREGSAGDEILSVVQGDPDINVLAIGVAPHSTGRGKLTAWLAAQLGSKLFIPLLMVPGNLTDEQLLGLI